jgi:LysM repeat protein
MLAWHFLPPSVIIGASRQGGRTVNTIKTVFLAALLSAAAYGVYVGVTGTTPNFGHRHKSKDWEEADDPGAGAPIVSIDDAAAMPLGEVAIAAPAAGAPLDTSASPTAGLPSTPQIPAPATGDAQLDRYSSTQPYPSTQPDAGPQPPSEAANAADLMPEGDQLSASQGGPGEPTTSPQGDPSVGSEDGHADFAALMQSVRGLLDQNRLADAHLELSEWFGDLRFSAAEDAQLTDLLDRLAGTVVYSRQHLLERPYEVQPGDTLERIADAYEIPWELLGNINGIRDPRSVRPGDQLKVVKGPFNAYVSLSRFQLVLYLGNRYAGRFHIGVGKDNATREGEFVVLRKLTNPTYYGQPVIDKDDPNNPLGEFALDLGDSIFIHGTNDPQSIGRADSRGCIRLADRDIQDVFGILTAKTERTAGSRVIIRQ